jgi:MFS family permease
MSYGRNLFAVTAASFIGFMGFTLVMPFLPLYFHQLGVEDVGRVAMWSGLSLGVTPALTAILAPAWGRLADRFGRKIMVERSLASFVLVMSAMAFVTQPWHVFALRVFQGLFAGYGALTLAMAADSAPTGKMPQAIGTIQTAQRLGPALGPVFGGTVAAIVGLRHAFFVTAAFYLFAFVLVLAAYDESAAARGHAAPKEETTPPVTFRNVLAFENFLLMAGVIFGFQFVDRSFGPVLPLYVGELGTAASRVAFVSGVLFDIRPARARSAITSARGCCSGGPHRSSSRACGGAPPAPRSTSPRAARRGCSPRRRSSALPSASAPPRPTQPLQPSSPPTSAAPVSVC